MKNESEIFEWWEPKVLEISEREKRGNYNSDYYDCGNDFGSYKALNKGLSLEDSGILSHNVIREKELSSLIRDYKSLIKKESKNIPRVIADLGCGAGYTTATLGRNYPDSLVIGYEISHDAVKYAKRKFPNTKFKQKTINPSEKLQESNFDLILCQDFYPFTRTKNISKQRMWMRFLLKNLNLYGIGIITVPSSIVESINFSYSNLKTEFPLKRFTLATPRISARLPLTLSRLVGNISNHSCKRYSRNVYLLKNDI